MAEAAVEIKSATELIRYDVTEAQIAQLAEQYMPLVVKDLEDRQGLDAVHSARMDVKGRRIAVEKRRRELKADALDFGRRVDARAKELTALLEPIEAHLSEEEGRIIAEKERLKKEAEEREAARLQDRLDRLAAVGEHLPVAIVGIMTDEQYEQALAKATEAHQAEQERLAEERRREEERLEIERRAREEEEARLAKIREEQERRDREQAEREAKIRKEEEAIAAKRREMEEEERRRQEEAEKKAAAERHAKEAEERAKREAEERIRREQEERAERERREKAEATRQESLKPDREKIGQYAAALVAVPVPEVSSDEAKAAVLEIGKRLTALSTYIVRTAATL